MILVVGATGLVGQEVCRRLAGKSRAVRALVRPTSAAEKLTALRSLGAELVTGDLKDPKSLESACRGVSAVISTASSTISRQPGDSIGSVDLEGQLNLVRALKSVGVRRFLFVTFRKSPGLSFPLAAAKHEVEGSVRELNYTIIQASYFMEVWLSPMLGFDYPNARARIYGAGSNRLSWISFLDVANFCAIAVDHPSASSRTIELGGPEPLSPLEVVRIFEQESGRQFEVEQVPEEALRAQMDAAEDPLQKSLGGLMLQYAAGDEIDMKPVLAQFPMQLTSVRDYAKRVLKRADAAVSS